MSYYFIIHSVIFFWSKFESNTILLFYIWDKFHVSSAKQGLVECQCLTYFMGNILFKNKVQTSEVFTIFTLYPLKVCIQLLRSAIAICF